MRLIDADALKDKCYITIEGTTIGRNNYVMFHEIDEAPTIEPSGDSGVFIPDISVEQLRNAPLEGVEELLAEGVMRDVLEPSGDLISRQWLLDLYDIDTTSFKETAKVPLEVIIQNIKDAPSVSIQPKTIANDCDLISREDAIDVVMKHKMPFTIQQEVARKICALPSADRPTLKQTDTMIIADALRYLIKDTERHEIDRTRAEELREQILQYGASMCSSAERQTVIRSKTLMPTKDFKEWAKRIREVNPNAVVIPCDAEVVSADRPQVKRARYYNEKDREKK